MSNCCHNILHLLNVKVDSLWRYEQYLKDAKKENHARCVQIIQQLMKEDAKDVAMLREELEKKIKAGKLC